MSNEKPTPEKADPFDFLRGTLVAVGFLIAFFRKSLDEARALEDAEARLPVIIKKLQDDPDVLENGRRFHDLADRYWPSSEHEREGFISLLVNFQMAGGLDEWLASPLSDLESEHRALRDECSKLRDRHLALKRDLLKKQARIAYLEERRPAP